MYSGSNGPFHKLDLEDTNASFIHYVHTGTERFLAAGRLADSSERSDALEGVFLGGDSRRVRFAAGGVVHIYNLSEIKSLEFGRVPSAGAPGAQAVPIYAKCFRRHRLSINL